MTGITRTMFARCLALGLVLIAGFGAAVAQEPAADTGKIGVIDIGRLM